MTRSNAAILLTVLMVAGITYLAVEALTEPVPALIPAHVTLPPCPEEDSTGCYWDAETRGNGLGRSVINP